ncbi:protein of unknown function [Burkholderia multivorans]
MACRPVVVELIPIAARPHQLTVRHVLCNS